MLDVIAQLEAAGMDTAFDSELEASAFLALGKQAVEERQVAMACLIMTPDGGDTEPQQDQPDQDDDGGRDEDERDVSDA